MNDEARAELMRRRLIEKAEEEEFEWNLVKNIIYVAMEFGIETDNILDWTIMKFNLIIQAIHERNEELSRETDRIQEPIPRTLR